jgi:hypothetical protein
VAYVFQYNGNGRWEQVAQLIPSSEAPTTFGHCVALHGDTAVVGAFVEGAAYVFQCDATGLWQQVAKLVPNTIQGGCGFCWSVATSGSRVFVGTSGVDNCGAIYRFNVDGSGSWKQTATYAARNPRLADHFGESIAISGNTLLVGSPLSDDTAPNAGSAYLFSLDRHSSTFISEAL